ncbi:transmembrane and coiled-coil domains protein 2-like isoform X1 [Argiope bruennichi]|uniref:transmembrane and coiled-coil domains protein 2-like isoform X1 n=1 Tax=Argiope bruennichi TaxID=94029 RepID=UPI00249498B7|nr:transmembrane and coiled-coil domains protein 2-like isoform X1 [Argiope bruennichi]XP_055926819.1 transmembrane and coiled-coil domains protein 2-like isoform X1 [Argiope bruennichi]
MKRKKSPLQHRRGGTSSDSNDSTKVSSTHDSSKLSAPQHGNVSMSSPAVLHPPAFHVNLSPGPASSHLAVNNTEEWNNVDDSVDTDGAGLSGSLPSLGSNEALHFCDEVDLGSSHTPDLQRTKAAIEHLQQKIARTKELIKQEQTARDENVNEYLKLATNADKQQLQRIKSVFEKKNQKSAQLITQLQKKLENYNKRIRDLEIHGIPRGVLRDMGQGLKDVRANIKSGISGLSGGVVGSLKGGRLGRASVAHPTAENVMSKPREFAHLIKNKFGSADNINSMTKSEESNDDQELNIHGSALSTHSTRYTSDEENSSVTSESGQNQNAGEALVHSTVPSPHHHATLQSLPSGTESTTIQSLGPASFDLEPILQELRSQRDEYQHLVEEIESVKGQIQQESTYFSQALQEERYRYERLEEQMNDLIELHQNEIENLKQGIADMEEKVQYQSEERLRDVHDILDNCQTRISRMEHQQHQHLQQLVTLDAVENSQARALLLKLVNIALTVLQVVLLLVATLSNIIMPFLRTRVRTLTTLLLILVIVMVCHQWPELLELCRTKAVTVIPSLAK